MTKPAYPPARPAAVAVTDRFMRLHATARQQGLGDRAPMAETGIIESIIEAGFWASLRREEGRAPKISLAFLPPEQNGNGLLLDQRVPVTSSALTQLAPAVERPGIHLGIWGEPDDLHVWGATRTIPDLCFVLEVIEPGLLVIKYSRRETGKFGNVAVLQGDHIKVVNDNRARRPDCPGLLASLLGVGPSESWLNESNVLVQMAISMQAHGHGGSLLVVPGGSQAWEESIVSPIPYRVAPPFSRLAELVRRQPVEDGREAWQQELRLAIDGVAGLTAVDGATVINEQYELLAFGVKIERPERSAPVEEVVLTEPIEGNTPAVLDPNEIGGTRHLSAAQFAHDQRDALALVASQDGRFTIFVWSALDERVHAHRIETLLM